MSKTQSLLPYKASHRFARISVRKVRPLLDLVRGKYADDALDILRQSPRVAFVRAADGVAAPNSVIEMMRDLGRPRGDLWEVAVWEDSLSVEGTEVFLTYQVHNEAIVIPDTIDAIRALTGLETDGARSVAKTDAALGVRTDLMAPVRA